MGANRAGEEGHGEEGHGEEGHGSSFVSARKGACAPGGNAIRSRIHAYRQAGRVISSSSTHLRSAPRLARVRFWKSFSAR